MFKNLLLLLLSILAFGATSLAQNSNTNQTNTNRKTTTTTNTTTTNTNKSTTNTANPRSTTATTTTQTTTTKTIDNATTSTDPNVRAVRAAFDKLVKGIEESDVETVMSVYQNSAATLYFNNNGTVTRGAEQDRKNREARYPDVTNAKLTPRDVRIEMLGPNAAVLTCLWTQTQAYKGTPESASGRMTLVFKKIGKDWKIIHLHTSPDRPDTTRPVLPSERETQ